MYNQAIFQEEQEMQRLAVQNRLLYAYEAPGFAELFSGRSGLTVLDIGCNNGSKTTRWFADHRVTRVIGVEYNRELAEQAQQNYGSDKYAFYSCNVELPEFPSQLEAIMEQKNVDGFDIIYLSFVLMHLRQPQLLLTTLHRFLKPGGQLVIVEADDASSFLRPYGGDLLKAFLEILDSDPYSGNRRTGHALLPMLQSCGFDQIRMWHDAITADSEDSAKKQDIFTTFFSYLPEDVVLLRTAHPEDETYKAWESWLEAHFDSLKTAALAENSTISMGMQILSCRGGTK